MKGNSLKVCTIMDNNNRCIYCNNIIPEGEIICKACFDTYISEARENDYDEYSGKNEVLYLVNKLFKKLKKEKVKHLDNCRIELTYTNERDKKRMIIGEQEL